MTSITTREANFLVSAGISGPLEAAHLKTVLDAIDASQVVVPDYHLTKLFFQLRANGVIGGDDATLLQTAIEAAAAGTPISGSGDTATRTRAALRRLKAVFPGPTVEGLVTLIFT